MKKFYIALILVISLSSSFAQDIEIYKEGSTSDVTGTIIYASWQDPSVKKILTVKNTSSSTMSLRVTRTKIEEVTGAVDYLCWGKSLSPGEGKCYPASDVAPNNPWTSPDAYSFAAGDEGILWVYHTPNGNYGQARYRYYIEENGSLLDSVDVVYNYFLSTPEQKPASFSVYPNPAKDVLTVAAENIGNAASTISIFDISGKVILEKPITNGITQLDIQALKAGIYFYNIRNNKDILETKKLVVL